jgi:Xaa-Pro aminopeptidase
VPEKVQSTWELVRDARDAGFALVKGRYEGGLPVYGWEVDDAVRAPINAAGLGEYFFHRTGHSITTLDHGSGANIDNLESREQRPLIPRTCFSIEPGVYQPEFGVRSEFDVLIRANGEPVIAEGTAQKELIKLKV